MEALIHHGWRSSAGGERLWLKSAVITLNCQTPIMTLLQIKPRPRHTFRCQTNSRQSTAYYQRYLIDAYLNVSTEPSNYKVFSKEIILEMGVLEIYVLAVLQTGSTSMRNLLLQLSGCHVKNMMDAYNHNLLHKSGLRPLTSYSKTGAIERLTNYTKFLIVRHPYERLHSAFTFQFIRWSPSFAKTFGTKIKKLYWKNPSKQQMKLTVHIRFEDFLRFVGNQTIPFNQRMDRHWEPYYHRSFPCAAKFDYILKMETLHEDTRNIIQGLFKNTTLQLPAFNMYNHTNITAYNDIPQSYMRAIWEVYKHDFELFDYRWPL